ncbi:MAG: hypothetical protein JNK29_05215 [Anaerolineales bacterium]|nr:hypothetical protein [Anaerolineales bacterium]
MLIFAALLTKLNGLALIPAALVPLAVAMRTVSRRRLALTAAGLALLVLAALAWLSTMPFVTGQVFQFAALQRLFDNLGAQAGQAGALANAAVYGFWTFFASYGWGNLETWGGLYTLWLLGAGAAGAGLVFGRRRPFSAAIGWGLVLTPVSLVGLSTALSIAQNDTFLMVGRYWLPALPSVVLLLVGGWQALTPARWRTWAWRAAAWIIVGASWIAPFAVIAPAYAKPQPMTASQAARLAPGSAATFAGSLRLLGYVPPEPGQPGGPARLGVCWEALATPAANYPVQLEVIGPDGQGYGARSTWAGGGNYPPRLWEIGRPFCDTYETLVWESFPAPAVGMLRLRLQTGVFGPGLAVSGPAGEPLGDDVRVPFVVRAAAAPAPLAQAADYRFGGTLRLIGYEAAALPEGHGLRVRLLWQAAGRPDDDYKVFVHLRDTPQTAWTQSDQRPRGGAYPTPAWAADERVLDEHVLTWPAGVTPPPLTLYVGLYRAADGTRPAVQDGLGQPVPNGEVSLPLP